MPPSTAIDQALAVHHHYRRRAAWIAVALICAVGVLYGTYRLFFFRTSVGFSYAQLVCMRDITILPRLYKPGVSGPLRAEPAGLKSLAGYPLLATSTCLRAAGPLQPGHAEVALARLAGLTLFSKRYTADVPQRPAVRSQALLELPLAVNGTLRLELDGGDMVHDYQATADGRRAACKKDGRELLCDIAALRLGQAREYDLRVEQRFGETVLGLVVDKKVVTTAPITVLQSSIAAGSVIYDRPDRLLLRTDKQLRSADVVIVVAGPDGVRSPVPVRTEVVGEHVVVHFGQPLARETAYELTMRSAVSVGQGYLERPYTLAFATSGGPKPKSVNIGSHSVGVSPVIAVTFDQSLKDGSDAAALVSLKSGDGIVPVSADIVGGVLTVRPLRTLPLCAKLTLRIAGTTVNTYDVAGNVDWTYRSRVVCHVVETIGMSAKGRAIQAYRFGGGPSKIIYVGATHGDERGTKRLMDTWINALEAEPDRIPAHRSIIVIPNLNPDGYAAGTRRNANGVDLNRNFPANNWKADVSMPGGVLVPGGGGSEALSEPESGALAAFVTAEKPRLVLTYHSVGSLVQPNGSGDSLALARAYAANSRYYVLSADAASPFLYDTTGAFEDWLHDKLGLPALVIELGDHENSEWSYNATAMWKMVQMP